MADMYTMKSGNKVDLGNRGSNVVLADKFDEVIHQKLYVTTAERDASVKEIQEKYEREQKLTNTLSTNAVGFNRLLGLPDNATNDQTLAAIQKLKDGQNVIQNFPPATLAFGDGSEWKRNGIQRDGQGALMGNYEQTK